MSATDISEPSLRLKVLGRESMWSEPTEQSLGTDVPPAHKELLDFRRQKVESGASKLIEWDQVKHSIGKRRPD